MTMPIEDQYSLEYVWGLLHDSTPRQEFNDIHGIFQAFNHAQTLPFISLTVSSVLIIWGSPPFLSSFLSFLPSYFLTYPLLTYWLVFQFLSFCLFFLFCISFSYQSFYSIALLHEQLNLNPFRRWNPFFLTPRVCHSLDFCFCQSAM